MLLVCLNVGELVCRRGVQLLVSIGPDRDKAHDTNHVFTPSSHWITRVAHALVLRSIYIHSAWSALWICNDSVLYKLHLLIIIIMCSLHLWANCGRDPGRF